MFKITKAVFTAAVFFSAAQAQAANFLIVDISATGSGTSFQNVGPTVISNTFTNFYASLSYNLEGIYAPTVNGSTLSVIGATTAPSVSGTFTSTGFDFLARNPESSNFFNIAGKACYTNNSPTTVTTGSPMLNAACGPITVVNNNAAAMASYRFEGAVTGINFRVVQADVLPAITFAVPEPTTWALMLAGFGMVGYALRRRRTGFTALA